MTLKERRKYVAQYAKYINLLLQEVRADNPEWIKYSTVWNSILNKKGGSQIVTKKGTFRQSVAYHMNTKQLEDFEQVLKRFEEFKERKEKEQQDYNDLGVPNAGGLMSELQSKFWDYYYPETADYDWFVTTAESILNEILNEDDETTLYDAIEIFKNAFYANGNPSPNKNDRPHIDDTNWQNEASQGGKYL